MTEFQYQPSAPISSKTLIEGGGELKFIRPDGLSRCTWKPGLDVKLSPHEFQQCTLERSKILPNVLHTIGNTPLIRLNHIPKSYGIKCEMLAKCEFFNPAGSVKDRIALRMIEDAEKRGLLKPGDTLIEPTSGNTGLGLALAAAIKGYHCIIVMPLKMSNEKVDALKALGAKIVRTPTSAAYDSPESLISVAQKLCKQIPNSIILDQYRNCCNPIAHYEQTAQEIINQCDGKLDAVVCGVGTGGTACGVGRKIKELLPSCTVHASDPLGSTLAVHDHLNETDVTFYEVEGIDRSVVDIWHKTNDKDSFTMARRLIREEGLLCGGSSGAAMSAAIEAAKGMKENQRLVVILPDGMRNYMSKFINDSWMKIRDFTSIDDQKHLWWSSVPVSALKLNTPPTIPSTATCSEALKRMKEAGLDYLFGVKDGDVIGAVTSRKILLNLTDSKNTLEDKVEDFVDPVRIVDDSTPLGKISWITQRENFVLVNGNSGGGSDSAVTFATSSDLLQFIAESKIGDGM